jgi:N-acetylmuramoyl-L-alanine amidase
MKIAVGAGHTRTGKGTGAYYKGFNESEITRKVVKALIPKLKQKSHTVVDVTVDQASSQNAYLKKVCQLVNDSGAELFISVHCNASGTHLGRGVECYTWKGKKNPTATKICANVAKLGTKNRGVKDGSGLYVIKHTKPSAILVELFFLDQYNDRKMYLDHGAEELAEAIAKAIR